MHSGNEEGMGIEKKGHLLVGSSKNPYGKDEEKGTTPVQTAGFASFHRARWQTRLKEQHEALSESQQRDKGTLELRSKKTGNRV